MMWEMLELQQEEMKDLKAEQEKLNLKILKLEELLPVMNPVAETASQSKFDYIVFYEYH